MPRSSPRHFFVAVKSGRRVRRYRLKPAFAFAAVKRHDRRDDARLAVRRCGLTAVGGLRACCRGGGLVPIRVWRTETAFRLRDLPTAFEKRTFVLFSLDKEQMFVL